MNALARIHSWLSRPAVGGEGGAVRVAQTVQLVSLVYGLTSLAAIGAILVAFPDPLWRVAIALACLAANALAIGLVRANHVRAGAYVLVLSCWGGLLYTIARTQGGSLVAQSGLVLSICSAGLLLGPWQAVVLALISALAEPMLGANLIGVQAPPGATHYDLGLWSMQAAIFGSAAWSP